MFTRRWFIGGAASLGAFQGCRFLASPIDIGGTPKLRFGVVTDIHVIAEHTDRDHCGNTRTFRRALKWFDRQGVDAVMLAGDMADAGLITQLQSVADAWNSVFPNGRSTIDGRKVEKVFVYGNHDWEGCNYNYNIYGWNSKNLVNDQIAKFGLKQTWEEVFEEEYSPIYRKTIKGFNFIGGHWDPKGNGAGWGTGPDIKDFVAGIKGELDPSKPFFYVQHPHPYCTCYGKWAWGHDNGISTKVLSDYSNAIAFSGHSHYSLIDERSIWQGAFTSIGCGSLRYVSTPEDEFPELGYENVSCQKPRADADKLMPMFPRREQRNGLLVSVYDDHIAIERRDFLRDCRLADDWVMPLPTAESKPFAFAERAKKMAIPQFPKDASVKLERGKTTPRGGKSSIPTISVTFPTAVQTKDSRVLRYVVTALRKNDTEILSRNVLSPDYHVSVDLAAKEVTVPVEVSALPAGVEVHFRVTPYQWFGKSGKPIESAAIRV